MPVYKWRAEFIDPVTEDSRSSVNSSASRDLDLPLFKELT